MNDSELLAILNAQRNNSSGIEGTDLSDDQEQLLDYYYGRNFGNEKDDYSQFVTRDVQEVVDRMMSAVIKVFTSGSSVVSFDPENGEDIKQADQESDVVNYILTKENEWFNFVWAWAKTAFLEKNSYAKVWVEDVEKIETETYTRLSDSAFNEILNEENIEAVEHTPYSETIEIETPAGIVNQEISLHDVKINIITDDRKIKLSAIPSEEIRIASDWNQLSLKNCPYVAHKTKKTITMLIEQGFDEDLLLELPGYDDDNFNDSVKIARNQHENTEYRDEADESTREVTVYEEYILLDFDDDGRAELRKITSVGDVVLENEQVDFIPIATLCPNPMPHQHSGLSIADPVKAIQFQKTTLIRQIFDNLHLTNNPEKIVIEDEVCMDDLLESLPGGIKRATRTDAILPIVTPFTAAASFPMLDQLENMKQSWSGVSSQTTNLDPNVLSRSTEGAFAMARESVNELTETVVRTFAETGFKELALMTHELFIKNQDREKVMMLRGEYVEINPKEWRARTSMTVKVGLGTGDKDKSLQRLIGIAREQKELIPLGLVTAKNLYNTYDKIVEAAELKETSLYFTNPDTAPPKQPQPPPPNQLAEAEKVKGEYKLKESQMSAQYKSQIEQMKEMNRMQMDNQKEQNKLIIETIRAEQKREIESLQLEAKARNDEADRLSKETIEAARLETKALIDGFRIDIGQKGFGAGLQNE